MYRLALFVLSLLAAGPAAAATMTYRISGTGAGLLDGRAFDTAYTLILRGNTENYSHKYLKLISPLDSARVKIEGVGTATLDFPTRLGFNKSASVVFFAHEKGWDLLDFHVDRYVQLTDQFGPITGMGVFALDQFDVPTSLGQLSFARSSDVQFSAVPLPAAAPLLVGALAGLGFLARRRRRTV